MRTTIDEIYDRMEPQRYYVAPDLRVAFKDEYDPTHNIIRNRLAELVEEGRVECIDHVNVTVTYRRPGN